jgi:hypothetical protein
MGFSLEAFPMGGVHDEYQRRTKKEKRAAAGKATVCGAAFRPPSEPEEIAATVRVRAPNVTRIGF